jgi:hypothetical protein
MPRSKAGPSFDHHFGNRESRSALIKEGGRHDRASNVQRRNSETQSGMSRRTNGGMTPGAFLDRCPAEAL